MVARRTAVEREEDREEAFNELSKKVERIDLRQLEVFQPSLKRIESSVQTLIQFDYLSKREAKEIYVTKEEYKRTTEQIAEFKKYGFLIAGALLTGLIGLGFAFLQARII